MKSTEFCQSAMLPMLNLPRKKDLDFTLYGFEYVEFLNQGSFGKAYLVQSLEDNSIWVFKVVDMHYLSPEERKRSYDEALLLTQMRHENIVFCKSTYQQAQENQLVLVMEYCEHGDLQNFVSERSKRAEYLDEATLVHFAVEILKGLVYMHEYLNVIHRDIKPANIFMSDEKHLKIGDFGICRPTSKDTELVKTAVGSPAYMPPEMVSRGGYTKTADIWALGCVLYELATLGNAFEPQWAWSGDEFRDYLTNHRPPPLTPRYSSMLNALVFMMLRPDGRSRPSSTCLLRLFSDFQKQYYSKDAMKDSLSDMCLLEGSHPTLVHVAVPILMRFACEIHLVLKAERRHISDWESFGSLMMDNHPRGSPFTDYEDAEVTSEWIAHVVKSLNLTLETQAEPAEPARLLALVCKISTEGSTGAIITLKAFHTFIVENLLRSGCGLLEEFLATQIWIQDMVRVSAPRSLDRYESITEAFDYYCRDGGTSIHEGEFLGIFQDFHPGLSQQSLSLVLAFAAKEFSGRILTGSFLNMILVKPPKVNDIAWRKDREQEAIRGGPICRRKRSDKDAAERATTCLNATSKQPITLEQTATSTTTPFQNGTRRSEIGMKLSQRSAQDSLRRSQRSAQDSMRKVSYCSRQLRDNSTRACDIPRHANCHEPHNSLEMSGSPLSSDNISQNVISISPVARDTTLDLLEQGTASTSYRQPGRTARSTRSVSFAGHDSRVLLCCQTLHSMYKLCARLQGERDLIAQVMRGMFYESDDYASHVDEAVVEIQDVCRFRRHKVDVEFKALICLIRELEGVGVCWDLEMALTSLWDRVVEHRRVTDAGLNELYHVDSWAENFVRFTERYSISIAELFRRLFRCVRQCERILPELDPDLIVSLCLLGEHVTQ